eukprot:6897694-Prymnesium_polylepis.1
MGPASAPTAPEPGEIDFRSPATVVFYRMPSSRGAPLNARPRRAAMSSPGPTVLCPGSGDAGRARARP